MNRLHDKVALVTGSSRGIGAEIARVFAKVGAKVLVHGRDERALSSVRVENVVSSIHREIFDIIEVMRSIPPFRFAICPTLTCTGRQDHFGRQEQTPEFYDTSGLLFRNGEVPTWM
jgi:NAD(P)-dependent dehydrogenase (short-subunit alcohol dehydrogenase family)